MDKALATAEALLMERGIKFKRAEMVILMEAFLGEFNEAFFKDGETEPEDETRHSRTSWLCRTRIFIFDT